MYMNIFFVKKNKRVFLKRRISKWLLLTTKVTTDDIGNNTFRPNTFRSGGGSPFPAAWILPILATLIGWAWRFQIKTTNKHKWFKSCLSDRHVWTLSEYFYEEQICFPREYLLRWQRKVFPKTTGHYSVWCHS